MEMPYPTASPKFDRDSSAAAVEENELAQDGSGSTVYHQVGTPDTAEKREDDDGDSSSEESEFSFSVRDSGAFPCVTADEIFSGGRILPTYPVFNRDLLRSPSSEGEPEAVKEGAAGLIPVRRLLNKEREPREESSSEQLPAMCKKSASTGSSIGWRLRDMVVGRSHSDGKEKFVFLEAAPSTATKKKIPNSKAADADTITVHRPLYGKGTNEKAPKGSRRSFLPYRQELLGLFAPVSGLRRTYQPF